MVVLHQFMETPHHWGAMAVAPTPRSRSPKKEFKVKSCKVGNGKVGLFHREQQSKPRGYALARGDMILHLNTGVVCRVLERRSRWSFRAEAWSEPETKEDFAYWNSRQGVGDWCCWGFCVMPGEKYPEWFPMRAVPAMHARNEDGRFNPEYVEAFHDINPGTRKNLKPLVPQGKLILKEKFTTEDIARINSAKEAMRRSIEEGSFDQYMDDLSEPLDSVGDVKVTTIPLHDKKEDRAISYRGQKKKS